MRALLVRLEGPLQAWSSQGKLGIRDTEREPTRCGVLGMVGAALGMPRDDDATLASFLALAMAVRVDRAGSVVRDFHTTGGGRFRGSEEYFIHHLKNCVPTERFYLQDASFLVALSGDETLVDRLAVALRAPRYPLFLGRRACPPSSPPFERVVEGLSAREAVRAAPRHDRSDGGPLRVVYEVAPGEGDPRDDVPLSFREAARRYGRRYVRAEWISPDVSTVEVQA